MERGAGRTGQGQIGLGGLGWSLRCPALERGTCAILLKGWLSYAEIEKKVKENRRDEVH